MDQVNPGILFTAATGAISAPGNRTTYTRNINYSDSVVLASGQTSDSCIIGAGPHEATIRRAGLRPAGHRSRRVAGRLVLFSLMRRIAPLLVAGAALAHDVPHPRTEALRSRRRGFHCAWTTKWAQASRPRALRQAFDRTPRRRLDPGEQQALTEHLARTATLRRGSPWTGRRWSCSASRCAPEDRSSSFLHGAAGGPDRAARILAQGSGDWLGRRRVSVKDRIRRATSRGRCPAEMPDLRRELSAWEKAGCEERVLGANTPWSC